MNSENCLSCCFLVILYTSSCSFTGVYAGIFLQIFGALYLHIFLYTSLPYKFSPLWPLNSDLSLLREQRSQWKCWILVRVPSLCQAWVPLPGYKLGQSDHLTCVSSLGDYNTVLPDVQCLKTCPGEQLLQQLIFHGQKQNFSQVWSFKITPPLLLLHLRECSIEPTLYHS